jgi:hypothetical protein
MMGFVVSVDGEIQTGRHMNPFPALAASMDPQTWRKVSGLLAEMLDPERGGDDRLYRLLRRTQRINEEERQRAS